MTISVLIFTTERKITISFRITAKTLQSVCRADAARDRALSNHWQVEGGRRDENGRASGRSSLRHHWGGQPAKVKTFSVSLLLLLGHNLTATFVHKQQPPIVHSFRTLYLFCLDELELTFNEQNYGVFIFRFRNLISGKQERWMPLNGWHSPPGNQTGRHRWRAQREWPTEAAATTAAARRQRTIWNKGHATPIPTRNSPSPTPTHFPTPNEKWPATGTTNSSRQLASSWSNADSRNSLQDNARTKWQRNFQTITAPGTGLQKQPNYRCGKPRLKTFGKKQNFKKKIFLKKFWKISIKN